MKLLITGYPGWLTCRFVETRALYTTPIASLRALVLSEQLPGQMSSADVEIVPGDLCDSASLEKAVRGQDTVLHAAGVLHVKRNQDFYRVNRDGTRALLEAAVRAGVRKFVYVSSNAAQGFCRGRDDALEEAGPCRPESEYGRSKYEAEEIVRAYQKSGKIQTVILRPAMFYGPPVAPRHVGIYQKIKRGYFPVFGSGDYCRSVTYIDNLMQGLHPSLTHANAVGETFYIADEEIPTLNEIIHAIAEAMGTRVKLIHFPEWMARGANWLDDKIVQRDGYWMLPHLIGESHRHIACRVTKAKHMLGYNPKINFRQGYQQTLEWCRSRGVV